MRLLRHLLAIALAAVIALTGPAAAFAADDYRGAIDIAFPTGPGTWYTDDYGNGRSGGRVHRSTDLFGPFGTPIYAANSGRVVWLPTSQSNNAGWAIQILGDDGRTYAYYHLGRAGRPRREAITAAVTMGARIRRGQHIGRLGDSGNAAGGTPHLHFEIHDPRVVDPYGGTRRNPYASLRRAQGLPVPPPPPSSAPPATPTGPVLRRGDSWPAVTRWQRGLNRVRRRNIVVDGQFGPGTEQATIAFQRRKGLGPVGLGIVGPRTRAAMHDALAARNRAQQAASPQQPPPSPPPATADVVLRLGSAGTAVENWQRALNRVRRDKIMVDGDFGPATEQATIAFQRSKGLGPVGLGVVGPRTRAAMREALSRR